MRLSRRAAVVLTAALLGPGLPSLATSNTAPVVPAVVQSSALAVGATAAAVSEADQLLGVTWAAGAPTVQARWLTPAGWTPWEEAEDDSDAVDPAERSRTRGGTEPLWRPTGATQVELRVSGAARDLRLVKVRDGKPQRRLSLGTRAAHADERGLLGGVHTRADWGADESLRRGAPKYASSVRAVVVHHTAGGNDYRPADVPKKIRADYAYHVKARGWSDLGYNLVVDKFGGIWEGRHGGLGRATIGTHTAGFNTGTLGVSMIGDMTKEAPTAAAVRAFQRVAAYAGGTWRFDPRGTVTLTSGGSPKFAKGAKVTLGRVHSHRDTGKTACAGQLYDRLGEIRAGAFGMLGPAPTILGVEVTGAPVRAPHPAVITGTLSRNTPWSAALRDADGTVVARSAGEGTLARLEWNGLRPPPGTPAGAPALVPAPPGRYTWAIQVNNGFHAPQRREDTIDVTLPVVPTG